MVIMTDKENENGANFSLQVLLVVLTLLVLLLIPINSQIIDSREEIKDIEEWADRRVAKNKLTEADIANLTKEQKSRLDSANFFLDLFDLCVAFALLIIVLLIFLPFLIKELKPSHVNYVIDILLISSSAMLFVIVVGIWAGIHGSWLYKSMGDMNQAWFGRSWCVVIAIILATSLRGIKEGVSRVRSQVIKLKHRKTKKK